MYLWIWKILNLQKRETIFSDLGKMKVLLDHWKGCLKMAKISFHLKRSCRSWDVDYWVFFLSWWEQKLKFHDVMKCMSMKLIYILLNTFINITLSCWNIDGTILKQLSAIWPSLLISSMYCFKYFLTYI